MIRQRSARQRQPDSLLATLARVQSAATACPLLRVLTPGWAWQVVGSTSGVVVGDASSRDAMISASAASATGRDDRRFGGYHPRWSIPPALSTKATGARLRRGFRRTSGHPEQMAGGVTRELSSVPADLPGQRGTGRSCGAAEAPWQASMRTVRAVPMTGVKAVTVVALHGHRDRLRAGGGSFVRGACTWPRSRSLHQRRPRHNEPPSSTARLSLRWCITISILATTSAFLDSGTVGALLMRPPASGSTWSLLLMPREYLATTLFQAEPSYHRRIKNCHASSGSAR